MKIFLCHASEDKKAVYKVKRYLDHKGYKTLIDNDFIPYGGIYLEHIENAFEEADIMMCFLSSNFFSKKWTKIEYRQALFRQIEKEDKEIIPVFLEDVEPRGFLAGRKSLDLSKEETYDRNLLDFIKSTLGYKEEEKKTPTQSSGRDSDCILFLLIFLLGFWIGGFFPNDSTKKNIIKNYYQSISTKPY